jgi:tetratricopeptide (TPR) repeat protein
MAAVIDRVCITNSNRCTLLFFFIFNFAFCINSFSQKTAARYEIDAKRVGVNPIDKDALPRSREFIRLDSTYYVGHMYEGMYKEDKSSEYVGFRNAIPSLRRAFVLFQKDFGKDMRGMFESPQNYMASINRYVDFLQISNALKECYDNIEMADSVMWVLDQVDKYKFPKEHLATTTTKAWTYHRNRFFTSAKFPFLKNSVAENEKAAFDLCYYALGKIENNRSKNDVWFGPNQAMSDKLNVYHYLALLHCYNKKYDSADYYYQRMAEVNSVSWNNYGNMKHELGNFATAIDYFNKDKYKVYQKMLREPFYFLPMLDVYAGRTKQAMTTSKEAIDYAGSTPGFGWYNIALSRSYLYDGELDSADQSLTKAANFKEIHIGTTLTQQQYDFTINLLKLQLIDRKIGQEKFINAGWWYWPKSLFKIASLKIEKMLIEYVLINQMSANPERDRTVYDLFCSESTTTFDEAYYLIKDFSPKFFTRKYETYQKNDPRMELKRYFKLFTHQMQWADGKEEEAYDGYKQLVREVMLDTTNEKLFLGRLYEGMYKGSKEDGNKTDQYFYANTMYETYPQLVPFSKVEMKMKLNISGTDDPAVQSIVKELKGCNIDWTDNADSNTGVASISFTKRGDKYEATINTKSGSNKAVVADEKMVFKETTGAGKELALRLFGKGGARVFEAEVTTR